MPADELNEAVDDIVKKLPRRKLSGKKLVLFIILPILVVSGGLAALLVSGVLQGLFASHGEPAAAANNPNQPGVFVELPNILVNLNTGERRQSFLSIAISLELSSVGDSARIDEVMPRIIDNFQVYLRELRLDDLQGSAGLYRLREEL